MSVLVKRTPPTATLFPYTTLFRSSSRIEKCSWMVACGIAARTCATEAAWSVASLARYAFELDEWRSSWCLTEARSEEHTSELQSRRDLVCRLLLEKKKKVINKYH